MRSCEELEPLFATYVDGEGSPDQREAVQAHLERCATCRRAVQAERAARAALTSCRTRLAAHASPRLRERCAACACSPSGWWRLAGARRAATQRWIPLSFAATMLLAVIVVFLIGINGGDRALAAQLAIDHVKCFKFAPDRADADPIRAADRWKETYGWLLAVPHSAQEEQLELLGVRRCISTQGSSAHIMYKWHGQPLSVYVLNSVPKSDVHVERLVSSLGEQTVMWTEGGRTYAVVGKAGPEDITHIAHYLRQSAR
jgi:anti-sigma factor RsiW